MGVSRSLSRAVSRRQPGIDATRPSSRGAPVSDLDTCRGMWSGSPGTYGVREAARRGSPPTHSGKTKGPVRPPMNEPLWLNSSPAPVRACLWYWRGPRPSFAVTHQRMTRFSRTCNPDHIMPRHGNRRRGSPLSGGELVIPGDDALTNGLWPQVHRGRLPLPRHDQPLQESPARVTLPDCDGMQLVTISAVHGPLPMFFPRRPHTLLWSPPHQESPRKPWNYASTSEFCIKTGC